MRRTLRIRRAATLCRRGKNKFIVGMGMPTYSLIQQYSIAPLCKGGLWGDFLAGVSGKPTGYWAFICKIPFFPSELEPGWRNPRGGSWNNQTDNLRCAIRNRNHPNNRNNNIGFRLALGSP